MTPTSSAAEPKPMKRPAAASERVDDAHGRRRIFGRPAQPHQAAEGERSGEQRRRVGRELTRAEEDRRRRCEDEAAEERATTADHARAGVEAGEHGEQRGDGDRQAAAELADAEEAEALGDQRHRRRRAADGVRGLRQRAGAGGDVARGVGDLDLVGIPESERAEPREEEHERERGQQRVRQGGRGRARRTFGRHGIHISDGVMVCNDPRRATHDSPGSSQAMRSSSLRCEASERSQMSGSAGGS